MAREMPYLEALDKPNSGHGATVHLAYHCHQGIKACPADGFSDEGGRCKYTLSADEKRSSDGVSA